MCRSIRLAFAISACVAAQPAGVCAQGFEITPFFGYRFGGDFFELTTARPVDRDGAPAVGALVDVPLWNGLQFEAFVTHQSADFVVPAVEGGSARGQVVVDHFQGGGLQEFGNGQVRPFLTGMIGLSRYGLAGDDEIRLTLGAGGGVKLFPWRSVGFRFDSRIYTTFVDFEGHLVACTPYRCGLAFHTLVVWQAEFTAGLTVRVE